MKLEGAPGTFLVEAGTATGLAYDSVVNVSQLLVVDKSRFLTRRGQLDTRATALLRPGLKQVLKLN